MSKPKKDEHVIYWYSASPSPRNPAEGTDPAYQGAKRTITIPGNGAVEDAGIRAGEIIAYRAWLVIDNRLCGVYFKSYVWPVTPERSKDLYYVTYDSHRSKNSPQLIYDSGFHSFKSLHRAVSYASCFSMGYTVVFGEVALWGEVIEHVDGYRAEYARITKLITSKRGLTFFGTLCSWPQLRKLRKVYGV